MTQFIDTDIWNIASTTQFIKDLTGFRYAPDLILTIPPACTRPIFVKALSTQIEKWNAIVVANHIYINQMTRRTSFFFFGIFLLQPQGVSPLCSYQYIVYGSNTLGTIGCMRRIHAACRFARIILSVTSMILRGHGQQRFPNRPLSATSFYNRRSEEASKRGGHVLQGTGLTQVRTLHVLMELSNPLLSASHITCTQQPAVLLPSAVRDLIGSKASLRWRQR